MLRTLLYSTMATVYALSALADDFGISANSGMVPMPGSTQLSPAIVNEAPLGDIGRDLRTFYLQNFGDQSISALLLNVDGSSCGSISISPGAAETIAACGQVISWHDGSKIRSLTFAVGHAYKIFWDGEGWALADITADIQ